MDVGDSQVEEFFCSCSGLLASCCRMLQWHVTLCCFGGLGLGSGGGG